MPGTVYHRRQDSLILTPNFSLLRPLVGVRSIAMSVSVRLHVCPLAYLKTTRPNFTKLSVRVTYGRGSVLL